jgi:hypothetical protein
MCRESMVRINGVAQKNPQYFLGLPSNDHMYKQQDSLFFHLFFIVEKKYYKYKKAQAMPIRPSVAHSYKHLIPLQRSPRDS